MIYKKNFLREVICRADFTNPSLNINPDSLLLFKDKLGIPDVELKQNEIKSVELKLSANDPAFDIKTVGRSGTFSLNGGIEKIIIDPMSISLTVNSYTDFKTFYDLFTKAFNTLLDVAEIKEFKRLGLRYINVFNNLPDINTLADWAKYLDKSFISFYANIVMPDQSFSLRRNMNNIIFSNGDYILSTNIGVWNENFPGKIINQEFVLDLDCYIDNFILDSDEIIKRPIIMNSVNTNFFNKIITNELKKIMDT